MILIQLCETYNSGSKKTRNKIGLIIKLCKYEREREKEERERRARERERECSDSSLATRVRNKARRESPVGFERRHLSRTNARHQEKRDQSTLGETREEKKKGEEEEEGN